MAPHPLVEGALADPHPPGGLEDPAAGFPQQVAQVAAFDVVYDLLPCILGRFVEPGRRRFAWRG
jgi:hypothetical protein